MGDHSGYDQVIDELEALPNTSSLSIFADFKHPNWLARRRILKHFYKVRPCSNYDYAALASEFEFQKHIDKCSPKIAHISYLESMFAYLAQQEKDEKCKWIGTVHQPPSWFRLHYTQLSNFKRLDGIITMSTEQEDFFKEFTNCPVKMIKHGVACDFFKPSNSQKSEFRVMFSGFWLRNITTLKEVIKNLSATYSDIVFDLLVPYNARKDPQLVEIAQSKNVFWHANISDIDLLKLYQNASLLLMPVIDCTANNATVEAMACGLPIVCSDHPGLKDYTDPSFTNYHHIDDIDGFCSSIITLKENSNLLIERGALARTHAEKNLSWKTIGKETYEFFHMCSENN